MTKAIDAVRKKKMCWKKASKQFNVPKTTLMRLSNMKYGTPEEAAKIKRGRSTVLGKDLEEELVHYCLAMEASLFGLTRNDLRRMAVQLAERNNIEHPFKDEIAGKSGLVFFLNATKPNCQKGSLLEHPIAGLLGSAKKTQRYSITFWMICMRKVNSLLTEFTTLMRAALLWYNLK